MRARCDRQEIPHAALVPWWRRSCLSEGSGRGKSSKAGLHHLLVSPPLPPSPPPRTLGYYGRWAGLHKSLRSICEISMCFFGPRPCHIEFRHRVKKTSRINLFRFETLKLKIRRLKLWKPTARAGAGHYAPMSHAPCPTRKMSHVRGMSQRKMSHVFLPSEECPSAKCPTRRRCDELHGSLSQL